MYSEGKQQLWDQLLAEGQLFGYNFECDKEIEGFDFTYWCPEARFAIKLLDDQNPENPLTAGDKRILLAKGIKVMTITTHEVLSDYTDTEKFIIAEFTSFARTNCGT